MQVPQHTGGDYRNSLKGSHVEHNCKSLKAGPSPVYNGDNEPHVHIELIKRVSELR